MGTVIILRGPSGCGKSTYINKVLGLTLESPEYGSGRARVSGSGVFQCGFREPGTSYVCSTDSYFMFKGVYDFRPEWLGDAHAKCLQNLIHACQDPIGYNSIVVDNTNTTIVEIAPYVAIAEAYGYKVEIHCLPYEHLDLKELAARNKHGVPAATILKQRVRLKHSDRDLKSSFPRATIVNVEAKDDYVLRTS